MKPSLLALAIAVAAPATALAQQVPPREVAVTRGPASELYIRKRPADARGAGAVRRAEEAARVDGEAPRRQAARGDRPAARLPATQALRRRQGRGHVQARRAPVGGVAPPLPDPDGGVRARRSRSARRRSDCDAAAGAAHRPQGGRGALHRAAREAPRLPAHGPRHLPDRLRRQGGRPRGRGDGEVRGGHRAVPEVAAWSATRG